MTNRIAKPLKLPVRSVVISAGNATRSVEAARAPFALRQLLIDVLGSRQTQEGQKTKTELVYQYLTGPQFRHRIDAILEKFNDMREDLDRERRTMTKLWARREAQLNGVLDSTAGLYGDLQGIAGRAMPEIEGLDILMIEASAPRAAE